MRYTVKAQAFDRHTGLPIGIKRSDVINTITNRLFAKADGIVDVKRIFEAYWNDFNPDSQEVVFVQEVTLT